MILEAFSQYLHHHYPRHALALDTLSLTGEGGELVSRNKVEAEEMPAITDILYEWLYKHLSIPCQEQDPVSRILHTEVVMVHFDEAYYFEPASPSGEVLLESLEAYCESYDNWQFSRWLHNVKASDFQTA